MDQAVSHGDSAVELDIDKSRANVLWNLGGGLTNHLGGADQGEQPHSVRFQGMALEMTEKTHGLFSIGPHIGKQRSGLAPSH